MDISEVAAIPVEISPHLTLLDTTDGGHLAYHNLFGNISWVDEDLAAYLSKPSSPRSFESLAEDIGYDVSRHLLNSYFLVGSAREERDLIAQWLDERRTLAPTGYYLSALQISSSNACNFACSYCFADAADRRSSVRRVSSNIPNISFELASHAIDEVLSVAKSHGRDRIAVKFLGREPLINWRVIRQLLGKYADGQVAWAITTNGSLLDEEVASDLKDHNVVVTISLDGPPSVNDKLRVLKSGGPTSSAVEVGLRSLAKVGHQFGISSVISRETDFAVMYPFIDRIAEFGARELELTLVMQVSELKAQNKRCDESAFAEQLVDLYKYAKTKGLFVHGDWVDPFHRLLATHKFRGESRISQPAGAQCSATSHQISLETSGEVFPCRAMSTHYGHIDNLAVVLQSPAYENVVMRTFYNVPACCGCTLEGFCQGACLGSSEEASGDFYKPQDDYCNVYRLTTHLLLMTLKSPLH